VSRVRKRFFGWLAVGAAVALMAGCSNKPKLTESERNTPPPPGPRAGYVPPPPGATGGGGAPPPMARPGR